MIEAIIKGISQAVFSVTKRVNKQIVDGVNSLNSRVNAMAEKFQESSGRIDKIQQDFDASIDAVKDDLNTLSSKFDTFVDISQTKIEEIVRGVADEFKMEEGIITTNGAVVPEGMPTGSTTETLAKASVNPAPKTIDVQDSTDKPL